MAALSRRAAFAVPAAAMLVGAAPANPDALLIQRCATYLAAYRAYEAHGSEDDERDGPLWDALMEAEKGLPEMPARTMAGLRAKALVARHLATQPSGDLDYSESFTGDWPGCIVENFLALTA